MLYPLKLQSAMHVKVWGGRRLATLLRKPLPTAQPYGESWELHDSALAANGGHRGKSLLELTRQYGADLIGAGNDPAKGMPLLAKFIDAAEWLSVQTHPNDAQAKALEGEPRGKTEAWFVLHADPGARLVIGLRTGTTRYELTAAIQSNRLDALLVFAEVSRGDVLYIPANTVHALGPGILIYEIQQSSDTTYRLYDWGRPGLDGRPRELHLDKGVAVANLDALPAIRRPRGDLLVEGDYFRTWRHRLDNSALRLSTEGRFQALTCIEGELRVSAHGHDADSITLGIGETGLIPACIARVQHQRNGRHSALRSTLRRTRCRLHLFYIPHTRFQHL